VKAKASGPAAHAPPVTEPMRRRAAETSPLLPEIRIGEQVAAIESREAGEAARLTASPAVGPREREPADRLGTRWRMEP